MLFLRNLNLATRSALGFGLIGGLVLVLGLFALSMIQRRRRANARRKRRTGEAGEWAT
ncbi:hypothetical protein [Pseudomonas sp.]|uniref:hypothetical protein n=1 Tax=Pseudomonas sp. TaxID=306 RepID=UPI003C737C48